MSCLYLPKLLTVVEYIMSIAPQSVTKKRLPVVKGNQILIWTKHCGQVIRILVLHLKGPKFLCWNGNGLYLLILSWTPADTCVVSYVQPWLLVSHCSVHYALNILPFTLTCDQSCCFCHYSPRCMRR